MSETTDVNVLVNIAKSLLPVQELITGGAYLVGIIFAIKALMALKQHGEAKTMSQASSMKEPLFHLLVAGMLIYFPTGLDIMMNTTFGTSNIMAYGESTTLQSWFSDSSLGEALVTIVQTIGVFAFVKGFILLARSSSHGQQAGGTGKALTHIFGGILAVNIVGTIEMVYNTLFGTT